MTNELEQGTINSWKKLTERKCTKPGQLGEVYLGSLYPTIEINNDKMSFKNNSNLHRFPIIQQYTCTSSQKKHYGIAKDDTKNYIVVTENNFQNSTKLLKSLNLGTSIISIYVTIIVLGGMSFIRPALLGKAQYLWIRKSPDAKVLLMITEGMASARKNLNLFREKSQFLRQIDLLRSPKKMVGITGSFLDIRKDKVNNRLIQEK